MQVRVISAQADSERWTARLTTGTGYWFLALGWGGVITQPLALTFGKRPMLIISAIGNFACVIWQVYITNEVEWYVNKIIQGLFGSPIEMLIEVGISDLVSTPGGAADS